MTLARHRIPDIIFDAISVLTNSIQTAMSITYSSVTKKVTFAVKTDNDTIKINGSNQLYVVDLPPAYGSSEIDENGLQGQPVYVKSNGHVALAKAATGYQKFVGLLTDDVNSGFTGKYQCDGIFTMSDWTNIIGSTNLTPGDIYYLSDTDFGELTNNPSTLTGFCVTIGIALNSTSLEMNNNINILL